MERDGRFFELLSVRTTENAESGSISGAELTYQHQFTFLPGLASGLGVALNAAFMTSEVGVFDRDDDLPLFNQPDHIYNAQLFYELAPVQARIAYQRSGENLIGLGNGPSTDIFEDARQTLDAKLAYQLRSGTLLFVEAQNITGEDRRRFQGRSGQLYLDEHFGPMYRAGLSWRF